MDMFGISAAETIPDDYIRELCDRVAAGEMIPERARALILHYRLRHPRPPYDRLYPEIHALLPEAHWRALVHEIELRYPELEPTRIGVGELLALLRRRAAEIEDSPLRRPKPERPPQSISDIVTQFRAHEPPGYGDIHLAFQAARQFYRLPRTPSGRRRCDEVWQRANRGELTFHRAHEWIDRICDAEPPAPPLFDGAIPFAELEPLKRGASQESREDEQERG